MKKDIHPKYYEARLSARAEIRSRQVPRSRSCMLISAPSAIRSTLAVSVMSLQAGVSSASTSVMASRSNVIYRKQGRDALLSLFLRL